MLDHPFELAKTAWGNEIDIMIGTVSFENGLLLPFFVMDPSYTDTVLDFPSWVPNYPIKTEEEKEIYGEKLKKSYFGDLKPSSLMFEPTILVCVKLLIYKNILKYFYFQLSSDFAFLHVVDLVVLQRIRDSQKNNFVYRFDANADNNCFRARSNIPEIYHPYRRAIHMDELCYLFKPSFVNPPAIRSESFELIERMVRPKISNCHVFHFIIFFSLIFSQNSHRLEIQELKIGSAAPIHQKHSLA